MRILRTEFEKLLSRKNFLLIVIVVLVLNAYLMLRTANTADTTPTEYAAIYSQLSGMSDEEKLNWLNTECSNFSGVNHYDWYALYELQEECSQIVNYQQFLENIDSQAQSMSGISIFSDTETFNYRNIMMTPPAYEHMKDVVPVFDISNGILLATDNNFTDVLCVFIILFAVIGVMVSDREQGITSLLFPLVRGRSYLLLHKILVLAITIFAVVVLLYLENLLIADHAFGLGELSRPVQSLRGFIGCNFKITVLEYLLLYGAFKYAAFFAIGIILSLLALNTKNNVSFYGMTALVLLSEILTYSLIPPLSKYSIFRHMNLIAFTRGNDIFSFYQNINFWDHPIELVPASIGTILVIAVGGTFLAVLLYERKRNLEYQKINFRFRNGASSRMHTAFYYTAYKSLIMQKGIGIVLAFIAVSAFINTSFIKEYSVTDKYYEYYTNLLEGEITQDTRHFIESETARFNEIRIRLDELNQKGEYTPEMDDLYEALAPSDGFDLLSERFYQIENTENTQIFYDTGYKRFCGMDGYDDDMKYALAAMLLCILLISPLIANDNRCRMASIINATSTGKKKYRQRNMLLSTLYGIAAALLWMVPYAFTIFQYYGVSGVNASIRSIVDFCDYPLNITVWQYLILLCVLRTVLLIFTALTMLEVSSKCKNAPAAILINFAIFVLPIIIYLLGAEFMVNIGFSPLLSTNILVNQPHIIHWIAPVIVVVYYFINVYSPNRK